MRVDEREFCEGAVHKLQKGPRLSTHLTRIAHETEVHVLKKEEGLQNNRYTSGDHDGWSRLIYIDYTSSLLFSTYLLCQTVYYYCTNKPRKYNDQIQ